MGRNKPLKTETQKNNRVFRFELRLTENEKAQFLALEKSLGINRSEIVRNRVLNRSSRTLVDSKTILQMLDTLGSELGRSGNNINQLARHINTLKLQGKLEPGELSRFPSLIADYIKYQRQIEQEFRNLMRLIKGQR
ncbi:MULTISPECIES: plasmid mobilization protein [Sphingobacterium]|uniref:plasmid mobilization protein n=1 Tax=Sphingobacterium TaxID=28453 RepID=UPI00257B8A15|nr:MULTISPECIES: plasmid mobilization relaxosome protein MobC [Sphingobacterium]